MSAVDRAEMLLAKGGLSPEVDRVIHALIHENRQLRAECNRYLNALNDRDRDRDDDKDD